MAQNTDLQARLTPDEYKAMQQGIEQDETRALQEGTPNTNKAVQQSMQPHYPKWPTSKPGPQSTPPPPGMRPIDALRSEQMVEVGYNQETGTPGTLDPARTLPDAALHNDVSPDQLVSSATPDGPRRKKERIE